MNRRRRKRGQGARRMASDGQKKKKASKPQGSDRRPNLSALRSTAVVLRLQPNAKAKGLSYADILVQAKQQLNLPELGIAGMQFRVAASGARVLKIPGTTSDKADVLAEKLRSILDAEDVLVSRPVKSAGMRVSELDDSVTAEEVAVAIARTGEVDLAGRGGKGWYNPEKSFGYGDSSG